MLDAKITKKEMAEIKHYLNSYKLSDNIYDHDNIVSQLTNHTSTEYIKKINGELYPDVERLKKSLKDTGYKNGYQIMRLYCWSDYKGMRTGCCDVIGLYDESGKIVGLINIYYLNE